MKTQQTMYNDNYENCSETYVTLRIYTENLNSDKLTEYLGLEPTESINKNSDTEFNCWFLSSENEVNSKDSRRHLDHILEKIMSAKDKINALIKNDAKIDICCYWLSKNGNGGPTLSKNQFSKLAEIGVDLWFDVY